MDISVLDIHVNGMPVGVGNVWEYGLTYRLKDGKKMGIQDVLAGSRDSANKELPVRMRIRYPAGDMNQL